MVDYGLKLAGYAVGFGWPLATAAYLVLPGFSSSVNEFLNPVCSALNVYGRGNISPLEIMLIGVVAGPLIGLGIYSKGR